MDFHSVFADHMVVWVNVKYFLPLSDGIQVVQISGIFEMFQIEEFHTFSQPLLWASVYLALICTGMMITLEKGCYNCIILARLHASLYLHVIYCHKFDAYSCTIVIFRLWVSCAKLRKLLAGNACWEMMLSQLTFMLVCNHIPTKPSTTEAEIA